MDFANLAIYQNTKKCTKKVKKGTYNALFAKFFEQKHQKDTITFVKLTKNEILSKYVFYTIFIIFARFDLKIAKIDMQFRGVFSTISINNSRNIPFFVQIEHFKRRGDA